MKICLECEGITDAPQEDCTSCGIRMSETNAVHFPLRRGEQDAGNPLLGTVVDGKYLVQGVLGKGGMGTVFRATHQVSLVPVALKILNSRFSVRGEYRSYFLEEAQKAGRVVHEHAGRILDVGEAEDGTVYIAMEEVRGVTLHECLHGEVPLAPATVVGILAQITSALMAAHDAGLVHRDLTPRNVMVVIRAGEPFVKILDFGIAKGLPHPALPDSELNAADAPALFANPPYSAPEHLEGKDVDDRGDLYSLGVIAYEALTQTLPVSRGTVEEMAAATIRGDLVPMPSTAGVPVRLARLVGSLLARDPDRRPGSAAEVLETLELIRQPGSRVVRDVAVLLFVVGIVVLGLSYYLGFGSVPRLTQRSGGFLVVEPDKNFPTLKYFRSEQLREIVFDIDGFRASELEVEIDIMGRRKRLALPGAVTDDGKLKLDSRFNSDYQDILLLLAGQEGPVKLHFYARDQQVGKARFVVDDRPPVLSLTITDPDGIEIRPGGMVNADSLIHIGYSDKEDVGKLQLTSVVDGKTSTFELLDVFQEADLKCAEVLGKLHQTSLPLRKVDLTLSGADRAGNVAIEVAATFDFDFHVPDVLSRAELSALELKSQDLAILILQLDGSDEWDDDSAVRVGGVGCDVSRPDSNSQLTVQLERAALGGLVSGKKYDFEIRDKADNVRKFTSTLTFSTRTEDVQLRADAIDSKVLHIIGDQLTWSGKPGDLSFVCNTFYKPAKAVLLRDGGGDSFELQLRDAVLGSGVVRLSASGTKLSDGFYSLTITLEPSESGAETKEHRWSLRLFARPMRLDISVPGDLRFFHQVVGDDGPLEKSAEPSPELSANHRWLLTPSDALLLRGVVFWSLREGGKYHRQELTLAQKLSLPSRPCNLLHGGRNKLCVQLVDVFARPVKVFLGGADALVEVAAGLPKDTVRILEFQYQRHAIHELRDPLYLEYNRQTRVVLRTSYDLLPGDQLKCKLRVLDVVDQLPLTFDCDQLEQIPGGGTQLTFTIGYDKMAAIVGKGREDEDLRRGGGEFDVQMQLSSPVSELVKIPAKIKIVRSTLVARRLGQWFDRPASKLSPKLSIIEMVPVLRPIGETYSDPVSAVMRAGALFVRKQAIDVSKLHDFYLQSQELSRGQYAHIVDAYARQARLGNPVVVHHPNDPLDQAAARRHLLANMVPLTHTLQSWEAAVRRDPDAPMTGISFYQAFAMARMAGQVVVQDPDAFRLPLAVELELAALPPGIDKDSLNGLRGSALLEVVIAKGDSIKTRLGVLRGVDFGVREWVLDLSWPTDSGAQQIVASIMKDYEEHLLRARGLGDKPILLPDQMFELRRIGVVRGRSFADRGPVTDLSRGLIESGEVLTKGVPGVVKTLYLARTGLGLHRRPHRSLREVGMRLAGGDRFLELVRER